MTIISGNCSRTKDLILYKFSEGNITAVNCPHYNGNGNEHVICRAESKIPQTERKYCIHEVRRFKTLREITLADI